MEAVTVPSQREAVSCSRAKGGCRLFRARGKLSAVPSQMEAVSCSGAKGKLLAVQVPDGSCQLFRARAMPSAVQGNRPMSLLFNIGSCTDLVNRVFVGQDKLKFYAPEKKTLKS